MISLESARELKEAGLIWQPAQGDKFAIPDRGLDDRIFVINDMAAIVALVRDVPAVTFHGTAEWALDYLYVGEAIWLPEESQLRERLREELKAQGIRAFDLVYAEGSYTCRFGWHGQVLAFSAADAAEAYAAALLYMLRARGGRSEGHLGDRLA